MAACVICKKPVDEENWVKTGGDVAKVEGKTYYFCGLQHKMKFVANPALYIQSS